MTFIQSLKDNKLKPSIKSLLILLIFVIYLVFSYFWSVKSDIYAYDFLPQDTIFYYEWPKDDFFDLKLKEEIDLLDLSVPQEHFLSIKTLLSKKFVDVQEIVWFRVGQNDEDYYLLRFRSISDKFVADLQQSQDKYKFRKVADDVLLVYTEQDLILPELVTRRFSINHIKEGNNIYWQIGDEPDFLLKTSETIKPFLSFKDVYLNIQEDSLNLFQIYNEEQIVDDKFSDILFPQNFDLLVALRASSTEGMLNYIGNQVIMANFNNLPYFNLTQDKFDDYFLKDSVLWQKEDDWLLVRQIDWWPLVTDLSDSLELAEQRSLLPDGTVYTELVVKEDPSVQHFEYLDHALWQIDGLFGANIGQNYYLSNSRQVLESLISQQNNFAALLDACIPNSDYTLLDFAWWDSNKLKNVALKDYLLSKNIDHLKVFSYQNSIIRGINWCL